MSGVARYDTIGSGYTLTRRADPLIAQLAWFHRTTRSFLVKIGALLVELCGEL